MSSGMESEFVQLNETRRGIYNAIQFLNDESFSRRMRSLLMQYEASVRESFDTARQCPLQSRKMARIISGLTEIIYTMSRGKQMYRHYCESMCNIVAYYISCELCAAQEQVESEESIVERIKIPLQTYVNQDTKHWLRTFVAIPMIFNRTDIMTELYGTFLFPQWDKNVKIVQVELEDKIYIQYILVFYQWQSLMSDEAKREKIMEFADKFMRPSRSLALNQIYVEYLPKYSARSTATRYILEHLKQTTCRNLQVVSKVDNRMPLTRGEEVITPDKEEFVPQPALKMFYNPTPPSSPSQEIELPSTDQPASLPGSEIDCDSITCHCSVSSTTHTRNPSHESVQIDEEMSSDDKSTCVLYSATQLPEDESLSIKFIYPVQPNFHASSSSESLAKHRVDCEKISPLSSFETLRWHAGERLLIASNATRTPSADLIDFSKLEKKARNFEFKRQKFVKLGKAHNKFYKDLMSLQRKNLRNLQEEQQLQMIRQATKRSQQLRALNDKRRCEAKQLEHHLAAIRR